MRVRFSRLLAIVTVASLVGAMVLPGISVADTKHPGGTSVQRVITVPADSWESDDDTATAKTLPAMSSHTLSGYEDEDWMKFSVAEDDTPYWFETQGTDGNDDFDLHMYLYELNADGTLTDVTNEDDHDYWNSYSEYITERLDAGNYLLLVTGHGDDDTGMYDLRWGQGYARRVYGADRYATANAISGLMYQQHTFSYDWDFDIEGIVIASGTNPADGLAGSVLASAIDAPLMLSSGTGLSAATLAEIERALRPEVYYSGDSFTIYILGGPAAVPAAVETQLEASVVLSQAMDDGNLEIVRLAGADRYETASKIAEEFDDVYGASTTAYIVNGAAWADALSVAAPAVYDGSVILPVTFDTIPQDTLDALAALSITEVFIVGGEMVVSPAVEAEFVTALGDPAVTRVAGSNRYETAQLVAAHGVDDVGLNSDRFVLVSGETFPDALAAGPMIYQYSYGGGVEGPILLTPKAALSSSVKTYLDDYGMPTELCYIIGGTSAVSDTVVSELTAFESSYVPMP